MDWRSSAARGHRRCRTLRRCYLQAKGYHLAFSYSWSVALLIRTFRCFVASASSHFRPNLLCVVKILTGFLMSSFTSVVGLIYAVFIDWYGFIGTWFSWCPTLLWTFSHKGVHPALSYLFFFSGVAAD